VGEVSQHSEYFAFGETFIEEHKDSHNSPYKFNGKELDEETGFYYYGARYYDPRVSFWMSVDNEKEKYHNWNPYNYCKQSPISRYDPDGNDDIFTSSGRFVEHRNNGTNHIMIQQGDRLSRIDNFDGSSKWFSTKDNDNRSMMSNVVRYYLGGLTKTSLKDGVENDQPDALAYYDKGGDKGIRVALDNGYFPSILSDSKNLLNTLIHENKHKLDDINGISGSYFTHSNVYVYQMGSNVFSKCTNDFQLGMISNFKSYLQGIKDEKQVNQLVIKFNKTNKGGFRVENHEGSGGFRLYGKDGKQIQLPLKATPKTSN
jgi:RHS repeat-associated protein